MKKYEQFLDKYPSKQHQPGEVISHQGDKPPCAYIIRTGLVKVYDINKEGEIKIISFDGRYEAFSIAWIFSKSEHSLYYYEAFTKCRLSIVPREEYMAFLISQPEVSLKILSMYVDRYLDFSRRINGLTQLKAEDKILYSLDFLSRRFGGDHEDLSKVEIVIPLSQQELADFVGLTRETVSTVMNTLRRKKVVKYRGIEGLEVNIKKVEELTSI